MVDRRSATKWGLILGVWTVVTLVYSSHLYVFHNILTESTTWRFQLAEASANFYVWAALTPVALYLARRFPLLGKGWVANGFVHLLSSLAVSLVQVWLHTIVDLGLIHGTFRGEALLDGFLALFARTYHFGLLVYWAIVATYTVITALRQQARAAAELEARLAQAQLQALKMQLHPHFLFNTLHAISALVRKDPDAADRMIARLSEFLRLSLEAGSVQEVPLERELDFLDRYLEIEKIRFRDRLDVRMEIAPETRDAMVPNLILQPLVENAIRHGLSKRRGAGLVEVRAERRNGTLRLAVRDDGAGLDGKGGTIAEGIGLANTRARLEQLYGDGQRLEIQDVRGGGVEVTLDIPFRPERDGRVNGDGDGTHPNADRR